MPMVEKANTQISANPKREPACAANTSSLMSTNPPTAVMMPSVISISPPMHPFHGKEFLGDVLQSGGIVCVHRVDCLLGVFFDARRVRAFGGVSKLAACLIFHDHRVGGGDLMLV